MDATKTSGFYVRQQRLWYNKRVKGENMETLYPITLSYTMPAGTEHSVVITNEGQSEDEYHKMFSTCGYDVAFCVE
jgi:hypothetical protein